MIKSKRGKDMNRCECVELTVLCLLYTEHKILLQKRTKKDWRGYALPGGHVEKGESFVDALIREMKEETGLCVMHPKLCGVKQFPIEEGRYVVLLFKSNEFSGELCSSSEGKMEWVNRHELAQLDTVEDLEELLVVMESDDLNEFQYTIEKNHWFMHLK